MNVLFELSGVNPAMLICKKGLVEHDTDPRYTVMGTAADEVERR